jgi:hypothetical protein
MIILADAGFDAVLFFPQEGISERDGARHGLAASPE